MSDTAEAKYKYDKNSSKLSRVPQGRRLGDERLEVLVVLDWVGLPPVQSCPSQLVTPGL